jgi:integrase/recombinase XerD
MFVLKSDVLAPFAPANAERHPAVVYLAGLAIGSRRTMRRSLDVIAAIITDGRCNALTLDWSRVRYQHAAAVRVVLGERHTPGGANKALSALRGVLRAAWLLGLMGADDYRLAAEVEAVRGVTLPAGRALSSGELRALFRACADDNRPSGVRDAAIIALAYGAGLRRSEIVALDTENFDCGTGAVTVRRGKGRKDRVAYVANGAFAALNDWVAIRPVEPGALFWPVNKSGRLLHRRMSDQAIYMLMRRRATEAGVAAFSPHDCRRTMISDLLDAGVDIATVQQLAGHSTITTTARYDRRGEATKRKASGTLSVPYIPNKLLGEMKP